MLSISILVLWSKFSVAQVDELRLSISTLNPIKTKSAFSGSLNLTGNRSPAFGTPTLPMVESTYFGGPVFYDAFFCRMEVKTAKSLGIMLKIHAGEYDSYALPR